MLPLQKKINFSGAGDIMRNTISKFIKKHQLLRKNSTVLVGVSGGPDSMALLHYYLSIQAEWNLKLIALSVDHQLRGPESKADIHYVQDICERWGIAFVETSIDVQAYKKEHRVGTQIAAREVRYHFFAEQMKSYHADYLALGHHADDQIETMLMGFVRSASTTSLSGIPIKRPFASGFIVRPLLCMTKADIMHYCWVHEMNPRMDGSNEDTDYTRNYFRKHIIPIIKERNNNIHTTVQRLSESLQADGRFLQDEAKRMVHTIVTFGKKNKQASFKINVFKSYPLSLQRRSYHLILDYLYNNKLPGNLSYIHEDIFFGLLEKARGNTQVDFPHQLKVEKSYEKVVFSFPDKHPPIQEILHIPGKAVLPNSKKLTACYTDYPVKENRHVWVGDAKAIALPLHIRTRKNGDRMSWKGLNGSKKIKDIFIDAKIPRKERDIWPLVTDDDGEILWLVGLTKSKQTTHTEGSLYIQLEYKELEG